MEATIPLLLTWRTEGLLFDLMIPKKIISAPVDSHRNPLILDKHRNTAKKKKKNFKLSSLV